MATGDFRGLGGPDAGRLAGRSIWTPFTPLSSA